MPGESPRAGIKSIDEGAFNHLRKKCEGCDRAVRPRGHHVGRPGGRIIGDRRVPLKRPRDIGGVKLDAAFHDLHRESWQVLKDEVLKGYARTVNSNDFQ